MEEGHKVHEQKRDIWVALRSDPSFPATQDGFKMNLGKLIEKLKEYPEDYTVAGDCIVLEPNGMDWLKGETDIYIQIETLKTEQPAKDVCQACNGKGEVLKENYQGNIIGTELCSWCKGTGKSTISSKELRIDEK